MLSGCPNPANRIVYEVSIKLDNPGTTNEFMSWLRNGHIQEVLKSPGFLAAELYRCKEATAQGADADEVVVRYTVASAEDLDRYVEHDAARLKKEALDKFGDRMEATRRIMGLNGTIFP